MLARLVFRGIAKSISRKKKKNKAGVYDYLPTCLVTISLKVIGAITTLEIKKKHLNPIQESNRCHHNILGLFVNETTR